MRRRLMLTAAAAGAVVTALAAPAFANPRNEVEQPPYDVVAVYDGFEVREYQPRLLAEVRVEGNSAKKATSAGFRILASFIFGNNTARDEIAMTAPVARSQEIAMTAPVGRKRDDATWVVSFTMPTRWTRDTLPRPKDERVRIRELPTRRYAVRSFSGAPSERTVETRGRELRRWANDAGLETTTAVDIYNRYDPPWIPWFMRRNEIWVELEMPAPETANP